MKNAFYKKNSGYSQSHYMKVTQGDIFMEQKMRFGLVGNTEKKMGGRLLATFEGGFVHVFRDKKKISKKNFVPENIFVYCSTEDTSLRDFYIMTLTAWLYPT
jgi:hypothetical protein